MRGPLTRGAPKTPGTRSLDLDTTLEHDPCGRLSDEPAASDPQAIATSVPAEGPAYGLDFAWHSEFSLRALQAQKWHVHRSRTFGVAWTSAFIEFGSPQRGYGQDEGPSTCDRRYAFYSDILRLRTVSLRIDRTQVKQHINFKTVSTLSPGRSHLKI